MVAIKDMEMPSCCRKTIKLNGTIIAIKICPMYESCNSKLHKVIDFNIKPSDCPLVEIEIEDENV